MAATRSQDDSATRVFVSLAEHSGWTLLVERDGRILASEHYNDWHRVERRRRLLETKTPALFVGRSGTRLTIYSIENIFKKHVRIAEIKRHITPHSLRHTMAAMLVSSGADIREVQEILGHASILSTQVYTKLPIQKGRRATVPMPARVFETSAPKLPIKK